MVPTRDKHFTVSMVVSCKEMSCGLVGEECDACLEAVVAKHLLRHERFRASRITTANGSRQFGVSLDVICRKPDCTADLPRGVACCTASADKCEMCLSTIASRDIRELRSFHVKEIQVA